MSEIELICLIMHLKSVSLKRMQTSSRRCSPRLSASRENQSGNTGFPNPTKKIATIVDRNLEFYKRNYIFDYIFEWNMKNKELSCIFHIIDHYQALGFHYKHSNLLPRGRIHNQVSSPSGEYCSGAQTP